MADYSGYKTIPKINVTIKDVHDTLGESTYDLKSLCTSSKINIFSMYKPMDCTDNCYPGGTTGDYGIIPKSCSLDEVASLYDGFCNGWTYKRPTGNYRLSDFAGYYHGANACNIDSASGTEMCKEDDSLTIIIGTKKITTSQLSISDIKFPTEDPLYVGIYVPELDKVLTVKTAATEGSIKIPKLNTEGTWEYYVILSTLPQSQLEAGNLLAANYYTVPGQVKGSFTLKLTSWKNIRMSGHKSNTLVANPTSEICLYFTNQGSTNRTISTLIMFYVSPSSLSLINASTLTQENKGIYRFDLISAATTISAGETLAWTCSELDGFPDFATIGYYFRIYGEAGKTLCEDIKVSTTKASGGDIGLTT